MLLSLNRARTHMERYCWLGWFYLTDFALRALIKYSARVSLRLITAAASRDGNVFVIWIFNFVIFHILWVLNENYRHWHWVRCCMLFMTRVRFVVYLHDGHDMPIDLTVSLPQTWLRLRYIYLWSTMSLLQHFINAIYEVLRSAEYASSLDVCWLKLYRI